MLTAHSCRLYIYIRVTCVSITFIITIIQKYFNICISVVSLGPGVLYVVHTQNSRRVYFFSYTRISYVRTALPKAFADKRKKNPRSMHRLRAQNGKTTKTALKNADLGLYNFRLQNVIRLQCATNRI